MNLPNYFLADLPPEATLSPGMLDQACQALKRNREQYLTNRSTQKIINLLSEIADNWRQPDYPFRRLASEHGPSHTGFSRETLMHGLDTFFAQLSAEGIHALLIQELGHQHRLDHLASSSLEENIKQSAIVHGPELLAHITAGNIPTPTLMSIVLGLLTRSAQLVKCASGTSFIPRLFAHSLYEAEPKVASCLELAEWKGGNQELERVLFQQADCVTATGDDETLASIRSRLPVTKRFIGYGHRVSFAFVAHDILSGFSGKKLVKAAAHDVIAWDQLGCLSPHVIYVQAGGSISPEHFARMLSNELEQLETTHPRGPLPIEVSANIASRRSFYDLRASHSSDTQVWWSKDSTAWSVVYEDNPTFQISCLHRFIYVKRVAEVSEIFHHADNIHGKVSTVGLAASEGHAATLAMEFARWGVTRVCRLGEMQNPPLTWRHDGRPPLADLVSWTNWER